MGRHVSHAGSKICGVYFIGDPASSRHTYAGLRTFGPLELSTIPHLVGTRFKQDILVACSAAASLILSAASWQRLAEMRRVRSS